MSWTESGRGKPELAATSTVDARPQQSRIDYREIFKGSPALFLLVEATDTFPIADASEGFLLATHTRREAILGRPLFEVFPSDPRIPGSGNPRASLLRVLAEGKPDTMALQRYDLRRPEGQGEGFEERYWSAVNTPIFGADGRIEFILHRVEDVSALFQTNRALTDEGERLRL